MDVEGSGAAMTSPILRHYILDEQGNPVPESDYLAWARWYETADRQVAETYLGDIRISTVFLSLPHISKDSSEYRTMLFETMVFADQEILNRLLELSETDDRGIIASFLGTSEIQKRYATRAEALEGHKNMCDFIKTCLGKGLVK